MSRDIFQLLGIQTYLLKSGAASKHLVRQPGQVVPVQLQLGEVGQTGERVLGNLRELAISQRQALEVGETCPGHRVARQVADVVAVHDQHL